MPGRGGARQLHRRVPPALGAEFTGVRRNVAGRTADGRWHPLHGGKFGRVHWSGRRTAGRGAATDPAVNGQLQSVTDQTPFHSRGASFGAPAFLGLRAAKSPKEQPRKSQLHATHSQGTGGTYADFFQLPYNPPDDLVNNYRKRDDGDLPAFSTTTDPCRWICGRSCRRPGDRRLRSAHPRRRTGGSVPPRRRTRQLHHRVCPAYRAERRTAVQRHSGQSEPPRSEPAWRRRGHPLHGS
jgi:hypothetical protein